MYAEQLEDLETAFQLEHTHIFLGHPFALLSQWLQDCKMFKKLFLFSNFFFNFQAESSLVAGRPLKFGRLILKLDIQVGPSELDHPS